MPSTPVDRPLPPEFPLGFAAAFLAMAAVFGFAPVRDGPTIAVVLLGAAVVSAAVAVMMARARHVKEG